MTFDEKYSLQGDECFHCGKWSKMAKTGACKYCHTQHFEVRKPVILGIGKSFPRTPRIELNIPRGTSRYNAKLNEDKVREMRKLYADGGITYRALAKNYEVSFQTIVNVVKRKGWKQVE